MTGTRFFLPFFIATLLPVQLSNAAEDFEAKTFSPSEGKVLNYRIHAPEATDTTEKLPLILFFHGAGERGDDNARQLHHGGKAIMAYAKKTDIPVIILAPQCPNEKQWVDTPWGADSHTMPEKPSKTMQLVIDLLAEVRRTLPIDESTPFSPASGSVTGSFNGLHPKSNFLALNVMQDMNARADSALGRSAQQSLSASSFASGAAMSSAAAKTAGYGQVVDMTLFGGSGAEGDSKEMRMDESDEGVAMTYSINLKALNLNEGKIIKAAMPGRRFTESSLRKGWLYLDTWYVVGPWENKSTVDYTVKHPPEFGIDFDAKYYDGKFADRPGHPYEVLKWEFYQSDQVRCQPPGVYGASTYYAYTDVWFEEARDMLIAVASDDASSVWLNGQIVWQDVGQSDWQLGEGYRKVHFKQGFNDVLVRIENGPGHCIWSVVLCPPEMLNK